MAGKGVAGSSEGKVYDERAGLGTSAVSCGGGGGGAGHGERQMGRCTDGQTSRGRADGAPLACTSTGLTSLAAPGPSRPQVPELEPQPEPPRPPFLLSVAHYMFHASFHHIAFGRSIVSQASPARSLSPSRSVPLRHE